MSYYELRNVLKAEQRKKKKTTKRKNFFFFPLSSFATAKREKKISSGLNLVNKMMRWCECALAYQKAFPHTHTNDVEWKWTTEQKTVGKRLVGPKHKSTAIKDSFQIWFNQFNTLSMSPSFTTPISPLFFFCLTFNVSCICYSAIKTWKQKDILFVSDA